MLLTVPSMKTKKKDSYLVLRYIYWVVHIVLCIKLKLKDRTRDLDSIISK